MEIKVAKISREIQWSDILDGMSKGVKVKTRRARKIEMKYGIILIDKIPIIEEKLKQKKPSVSEDMKNEGNF